MWEWWESKEIELAKTSGEKWTCARNDISPLLLKLQVTCKEIHGLGDDGDPYEVPQTYMKPFIVQAMTFLA